VQELFWVAWLLVWGITYFRVSGTVYQELWDCLLISFLGFSFNLLCEFQVQGLGGLRSVRMLSPWCQLHSRFPCQWYKCSFSIRGSATFVSIFFFVYLLALYDLNFVLVYRSQLPLNVSFCAGVLLCHLFRRFLQRDLRRQADGVFSVPKLLQWGYVEYNTFNLQSLQKSLPCSVTKFCGVFLGCGW
jgi:hypothetical protein